jgi:hypothetical protein
MRALLPLLLLALCGRALGEACIVHSQGEGVDVRLCQENRDIPSELFRSGFCEPQLQGQTVKVEFAEHCPADAFGVCRNAHAAGVPYRQDIYYYGVASDARFLRPACEQQSQGQWATP